MAMPRESIGVRSPCDEPPRELVYVAVAGDAGQHDGELVAADPADEGVPLELRREAPRDLAQHLVADVVAERVVDFLEPRQVEHQQRDALARARSAEQRAEVARERRPVRQARQRIVRRLVLERALLRLPLADVANDRREQALLRRDAAQRDLDGQPTAVRGLRGALERRARRATQGRSRRRPGSPA